MKGPSILFEKKVRTTFMNNHMKNIISFLISVGLFSNTNSGISVGNINPKATHTQGNVDAWARDRQAKDLGLSPSLTQDPILGARDIRKAEEEKKREESREKTSIPEDFEKFLPAKKKPKKQSLSEEPFNSPWKQKTPLFFEKCQKPE